MAEEVREPGFVGSLLHLETMISAGDLPGEQKAQFACQVRALSAAIQERLTAAKGPNEELFYCLARLFKLHKTGSLTAEEEAEFTCKARALIACAPECAAGGSVAGGGRNPKQAEKKGSQGNVAFFVSYAEVMRLLQIGANVLDALIASGELEAVDIPPGMIFSGGDGKAILSSSLPRQARRAWLAAKGI